MPRCISPFSLDHYLAKHGFEYDIPLLGFHGSECEPQEHSCCAPDIMEICLVAQGRQVYSTPKGKHVVGSGEIFLSSPGEPFQFSQCSSGKGRAYRLQLRYAPTPRRFLLLEETDAHALLHRLAMIRPRQFPASKQIEQHFAKLFDVCAGAEFALKKLTVANMLVGLLLAVVQVADTLEESRQFQDNDLSRVLHYIETHLDEQPTLSDLAQEMGLSCSWFKTKFHMQIGMPPAEYVLRRKIEIAKLRLGDGQATVTSVAYNLGFSSSQYFATVFKRITGQRPHEYLKSLPR